MTSKVGKSRGGARRTGVSTKAKAEAIEAKLNDSVVETKPAPKRPAEFPVDASNNKVRYWLIKSEPLSRIDPKTGKDAKFSLSDLQQVDHEPWDGVRNHEAKNNMLNMAQGDILLFYHSNTKTPGIVGLAQVAHEAHPDALQFDAKSSYYDPKSDPQQPRWWCVDVRFLRRFRAKVSLDELRANEALSEMALVKRGRLSVTPVRKEEFHAIMAMEAAKPVASDLDCDIHHKFIDIQQ